MEHVQRVMVFGQVDIFDDEPCTTCNGARLRTEALHVFLIDKNKKRYTINDIIELTVEHAVDFFSTLQMTKQQQEISEPLLNEIVSRISFLSNVGLEYITLSRKANTLSGGRSATHTTCITTWFWFGWSTICT